MVGGVLLIVCYVCFCYDFGKGMICKEELLCYIVYEVCSEKLVC